MIRDPVGAVRRRDINLDYHKVGGILEIEFLDMLIRDDGPGYAFQLKQGATSLTEAWDTNPGSSQNHCMLGHAEEWFYSGLAGIRPDPAAAGFKRTIIKPAVVGDLRWVKAHHDSPYGRIVSNWNRDGETVTMTIRIPANTTATVHVPAADVKNVTVNGKPAGAAPHVKYLKTEGGRVLLQVESGSYEIVCR